MKIERDMRVHVEFGPNVKEFLEFILQKSNMSVTKKIRLIQSFTEISLKAVLEQKSHEADLKFDLGKALVSSSGDCSSIDIETIVNAIDRLFNQ